MVSPKSQPFFLTSLVATTIAKTVILPLTWVTVTITVTITVTVIAAAVAMTPASFFGAVVRDDLGHATAPYPVSAVRAEKWRNRTTIWLGMAGSYAPPHASKLFPPRAARGCTHV